MMLGSHEARATQVPPHRRLSGRISQLRPPSLCVSTSWALGTGFSLRCLHLLKGPGSQQLLLTLANLVAYAISFLYGFVFTYTTFTAIAMPEESPGSSRSVAEISHSLPAG